MSDFASFAFQGPLFRNKLSPAVVDPKASLWEPPGDGRQVHIRSDFSAVAYKHRLRDKKVENGKSYQLRIGSVSSICCSGMILKPSSCLLIAWSLLSVSE